MIPFATAEAEGAALADRIRELAAGGTALEEMAVLCRTNARLTDFEEILHGAGIPFQGASLLVRDAARRLLRRIERERRRACGETVRAAALEAGWLGCCPTSSASASSCARPTWRGWSRSPRRFDGDVGGVLGRPAAALRSGRRRRARRPPADAPPRKGARVRRGLPAAAHREGAAVEAGAHRRGARRGAAAALRRADARPARALADVGGEAVALPARARRPGRRRLPNRFATEALRAVSRAGPARREAARVAARPRARRRRAAVRRLPRQRPAGDRRRPAASRSASSRSCTASARRSSTATAPTCSACSRPLPGQASSAESSRSSSPAGRGARAAPASALALRELERARVGQRPQAALADQRLVDAAEPAAVGGVDGDAERGRLAVHRPAGRDDEIGEGDQALRVDRAARGRSPTAARGRARSRAARRCAGARTRARPRARPTWSSVCGKSGFECRW